VLALGGHAVFGGGYGSGWEIIGPRLKALTGIDVGHAHNGYLDLAADIGFVGVALTVGFFLWLGALGFTNLMRGVRTEIAALALMVVAFALIGNIAGSFFLRHNSLYWALPVALFAMLRDAPYARWGHVRQGGVIFRVV
jgi:O-antigen ligase